MFHQSIHRVRDHNVPHRDGAAAHGARAHETITAYVYTTRHTRVHLHVVRVVRRARAGQLNPDGAQQRQCRGCGTRRAPNQRCSGDLQYSYSTHQHRQ